VNLDLDTIWLQVLFTLYLTIYYYIPIVAALGLLASSGPKAYKIKDNYNITMATLGGISALGNMLKSYQQRTGKPRDIKIST
jgi:hypothetical protein